MAWKMLLTSDIGLFSLIGILFMVGMAIWFARFYTRKMHEEEAQMIKDKRMR